MPHVLVSLGGLSNLVRAWRGRSISLSGYNALEVEVSGDPNQCEFAGKY